MAWYERIGEKARNPDVPEGVDAVVAVLEVDREREQSLLEGPYGRWTGRWADLERWPEVDP